jgi:four helix bundle protein
LILTVCSRPQPAAPVLAALAASTAAARTAGASGYGSQAGETEARSTPMAFQVLELSIELVDALAPLMPRIKQRDKALADQLSRAASSIALNCGEAEYSDPGNKRARLFSAAGSAGETRVALRLAVAWRAGGGEGDGFVAANFGDSLEDDAGVKSRLRPEVRIAGPELDVYNCLRCRV